MLLLLLVFSGTLAIPIQEVEQDGASSRKILGSSVVTSVSVIMDHGNSQTHFSDAVGNPLSKPQNSASVSSPIDLLSPDRYEFYTFDDNGDLVKRLMTLGEIQGIIASSDNNGQLLTSYNSNSQLYMPEKKVNDVVNNVQNVLKEEMESHINNNSNKVVLDTPDVSATWSMILPAVFGNSGEDIKLDKVHDKQTPETIVLENTTSSKPSPDVLMSQFITERAPDSPVTSTVNLDTPVITVAIVTRKPDSSYYTTRPLDEETTNKFLQLFKPQQDQLALVKQTSTSTTSSTEVPNKYLAVFLPPQLEHNNIDAAVKNNVRPTTFRPTSDPFKRVKPSPFKPTFSTVEPVLVRKRPSQSQQSALNALVASTLGDYNSKYKVTTNKYTVPAQSSTVKTTTVQRKRPVQQQGAQFVVLDEYIKTSPTDKRKVPQYAATVPFSSIPIRTTALPIRTTTSSTTTTPKPQITVPSSTTEELISTSSSSYYGGQSNPIRNKISSSYYHPSTSTQVLDTITDKVGAVSAAILDKIASGASTISNANGASTIAHVSSGVTTMSNLNQLTSGASTMSDESVVSTESATDYFTNVPQQGTTIDSQLAEMTVPELLDKLLLSSTNIYNLNSELETIKTTTTAPSFTIQTTESEESSTLKNEDFTSTIGNTAEPNLLQSIEQLISQTINDQPVHDINIDNKRETQTASDVTSTAVTANYDQSEDEQDDDITSYDILNQSVGSLLSQVVNSNKQTLTTMNDFSTTEDLRRTIPEKELSHSDNVDSTNTAKASSETVTEQMTTPAESVVSTLPELEESTTTDSTVFTVSDIVPGVFTMLNVNLNEASTMSNSKLNEASTMSYETSNVASTIGQQNAADAATTLSNQPQTIELLKTEASSSYINRNKSNKDQTTTLDELEEIADATEVFTRVETTTVQITTEGYDVSRTKLPTLKYEINYKPIKDELTTDTEQVNWKLVSTVSPHNNSITSTSTEPIKATSNTLQPVTKPTDHQQAGLTTLEDTTSNLDKDVAEFVQLCNELAFGFYSSVTSGISSARSVFVSPFAATSLLAMVFLGARGSTSGEMNEILRLDDMVTFNPHLILKNVSESSSSSVGGEQQPLSGVAISVVERQLYSDKSRGPLLSFYKERARQFYGGHVEEVGFREIGDVIRRRTNLAVKRGTSGRIPEYVKDSSFTVRPPLAGVSVSIFQTDCSGASTSGRDGELHFIVLPTIRQRRLVPIPAVVYRSGFLAGYDPVLDATAVSLGATQTVSTILVIPGQQGIGAVGQDGLARLEKELINTAFSKERGLKQNGSWHRLLRSLIPRPGLEVQIPRFSHRSVINATVALQHMGLRDLFDANRADLRGLNGVANELYLSDIIQLNNFATCGEGVIGESHHAEIYPATANRTFRRYRRLLPLPISSSSSSSSEEEQQHDYSSLLSEPRDYQRAFHDPLHDPSMLDLPLSLRPRQARVPDSAEEKPRLRFDRPFLYFVRHNPTGLLLHMGRFNPRLLP